MNKKPFVDRYGYLMVDAPSGHPYARCKGTGSGRKGGSTGYVREHRLVLERLLGRYLHPDEAVHHINGDKLDNRPENLEIMSHSEHSKLHWSNPRGRAGAPKEGDPCAHCTRVMSQQWDGKRGLCNSCYLKAKRRWKKSGVWPEWADQFQRGNL